MAAIRTFRYVYGPTRNGAAKNATVVAAIKHTYRRLECGPVFQLLTHAANTTTRSALQSPSARPPERDRPCMSLTMRARNSALRPTGRYWTDSDATVSAPRVTTSAMSRHEPAR